MKTLELNQMEAIEGASACAETVALSFIAGSIVFGGLWGGIGNAAWAYYWSKDC
jgi:hypothetical protein